MAYTTDYREASTGLTTALGGTAATPNAGPNNWVDQINGHTRQAGGGFAATTGTANANNCSSIVGSAPVDRFTFKMVGSKAEPKSICQFCIRETAFFDNNCYTIDFQEAGFKRVKMTRIGTGAGTQSPLTVNCSSLSDSADWTVVVTKTGTTTWTVSVTDGTTSVGPDTYTDAGSAPYPAGNMIWFNNQNGQWTISDYWAEIDTPDSGSAANRTLRPRGAGTSQQHYYGG